MLIRYFKELFQDKVLMKRTISLAIPIMVQNLVVSLVSLVDNLMVGKLGDAAISAVTSSNKFYTIVFFLVNSMVAACIIFMAQFNGANNIKKIKESFRFSIVSAYALLLTAFIIVKLFPSQLIKFIIDDPTIIDLGTRYISYAAYSYLPLGLSIAIAGSMRSVGDAKNPMMISIISIITNAILDYCLIFGKYGFPEMGVEGAAIATIIARIVEATLLVYALKKGDYIFDSRFRDIFDFDLDLAKKIIIKAFPLVLNEVLFQGGETLKLKAYSIRGPIVNTGYSMYLVVGDIFFVLFGGMAIATTVLVGTELGANHLEKAKDNGYKLLCFSVFLAIFFSLGFFAARLIVPSIYSNASSEAIYITKQFLLISGCLFFIYMFNCQCYFILRAGGDTKSSLIMDSGIMLLVAIPLIFIITKYTNISAVYIYLIVQLTELLKTIVAYSMVRKEKWVRNLAKLTR